MSRAILTGVVVDVGCDGFILDIGLRLRVVRTDRTHVEGLVVAGATLRIEGRLVLGDPSILYAEVIEKL